MITKLIKDLMTIVFCQIRIAILYMTQRRLLEPVNTIKTAALCPKSGQARREERDLVVLNERRVTLHGSIWGATRRDGAIFPQSCVAPRGHVVARLCTTSTRCSLRLVLRKNGRRRCHLYSVNRL